MQIGDPDEVNDQIMLKILHSLNSVAYNWMDGMDGRRGRATDNAVSLNYLLVN